MLDQSFNLSDSNALNDIFQLPTLAGESGLGRSDTITPTLSKALKGMDSGLFNNFVEEYRQGLENGWQSSQSFSSWRNGGDFLTGQSIAGSLSSSVDRAGNTLATARAITIGATATSYTDWVGSTDTNDYYKFTLANSGNFNLRMTGLTADADVQLLRSDGISVITSSTGSGTSSETISSQPLSAGTYYIRVYPYQGANTNYNLAVSATGSGVTDPGNTPATARVITVGSTVSNFQDRVDSTDTNDYYKFTLANSGNFNLNLTGMTADADVQLLRSDGISAVASSTGSGTSSETISSQLSAGTYYIRVYPYQGANTNYNLTVSATGGGGGGSDWFSQNLRDTGLISTVRSLGTDGNLSRNDMISVFRNAQDGGVIDATEITDLRTVITNASRFTMQDHVRVLSNKVVNGDAANQWWTGGATTRTTLGNLYAGSSANQMEGLISKWFLGSDRPNPLSEGDSARGGQGISNGLTYRSVSGSLFQNGISINDIKQGAAGTCYHLATLASLAWDKPSYVQNMFIDNGDNTFTVRFFRNGVADYVTVDRFLPTDASGKLVYANIGNYANSSSNELWVALAEKAYAQMNESGWLQRHSNLNGINSYRAIEGGNEYLTMNQLTGLNSVMNSNPYYWNPQQIVNMINSNNLVTFGINARVFGPEYSGGHALAVTNYDPNTGRFLLYNPWGTRHLNLTLNELAYWRTSGWSYTTT